MFLFTTLNYAYILSTPRSNQRVDKNIKEARMSNKWGNDDYVCRGTILNGMVDGLFDIYLNV